jgi:hypothetical protein
MECDLAWAGVDYARIWLEPYEVRQVGGADALWVKALSVAGFRLETARARRWTVGPLKGWLMAGVGVAVREDDAAVVQVPGAASGDLLRVMEGVGRTSRIDLQVTVIPPVSRETAIRAEWKAMLERSKAWPYKGRAPRVWGIVDETVTAYSGRRNKDGVYLRIYDSAHVHGHESDAYADTIRYELEATGRRAVSYCKFIGGCLWQEEKVAQAVLAETMRRGATMRLSGVEPRRVAPPARCADRGVESTLQWIERQVKPCIARLLELGVSRKTVLQRLGLECNASCVDE